MWDRELNSLAGARVHTKQNLPLPFQYINLPTLDDQFISSPSWLPSPRFELRTLAGYKTSQLMLYREIMAVCSQIHTKHINTAVWAERRIAEC